MEYFTVKDPQQHYVHLTSNDDVVKHPNNVGQDFNVTLSPFFKIDTSWTVAVTAIYLNKGITGHFHLCSDVSAPVNIGNMYLPSLRPVFNNDTSVSELNYLYVKPYYMPVSKTYVDNIRLYLTDADGKIINETGLIVRATLHFRKHYPCKDL